MGEHCFGQERKAQAPCANRHSAPPVRKFAGATAAPSGLSWSIALICRDLCAAECLHVFAGAPRMVPGKSPLKSFLKTPVRTPTQMSTPLGGIQGEHPALFWLASTPQLSPCPTGPK